MNDLTIESVEIIPIRVKLQRLYQGSNYQMPSRCTIVTRIRTRGGLVSDIYTADEDLPQAEIVRIVRDELVPIVVGMDAMATERCWDAMSVILKDQLRNRWYATQAIACIDTAIWDLVGKALDVPLYQLWGGFRDRVPMIGIGGYYTNEPASIEKEVAFFVESGMVGMKFKIGKLSPVEEIARFRRAVESAPEGFEFMVDANQAWTVAEAVEFTRLAAEFTRIRWFEEPCLWPNDHESMQQVRAKTGVPVAAGQMEFSHAGMRRMMEAGAIDVSNYDSSWGGGPTAWRRVASLAYSFGVEMGHHEECQVSSHLLASIPHGTYVEAFDRERDPIFWEMLANRSPLDDGKFVLPSGPGFGWELDEDFVKHHRADN